MTAAHLSILGPTVLSIPDTAAASELLAQPRPTSLLIYLAAARPSAFQRRDHLASLFWPESRQARTSLRKLIHIIRKALGNGLVETRGDEDVRLVPGAVRCDAVEFEAAYQARQMARALEMLGTTQPSEWIAVTGASALEDWASATRIRLADTASAAAWSLALLHETDSQLTEAGRLGKRAVDFAPQDERRLRRVLELMERIGDHGTALRLFVRYRQQLETEYNAVPAAETLAVVARLRAR